MNKFLIIFLFLSNLYCQDISPFTNGEEIFYKVNLNFISVGSAKMSINKIKKDNDNYFFSFLLKTNDIWDKIFPIRDTVKSWIDKKEFYTQKFQKIIIEPNYKINFNVTFNYEKNFYNSNNKRIDISQKVRDPYSFFYFLRTKKIKIHDEFLFNIFDNNKIYKVKLSILKEERINSNIGIFNCFLIEAINLDENKSIMKIWMTNDNKKIPIKIISNANFGTLNMLISNIN